MMKSVFGRNAFRTLVLGLVFLASLAGALTGWAQDSVNVVRRSITGRAAGRQETAKKSADTAERFIRIRKDAKGKPLAMETSIVRYFGKNKEGEQVIVDLIGVVHIGEKEYYQQLNERFEQYDSLLYELVAPEGTRVPRGGGRSKGFNPVAALQKGMKASLGLEFQLDHIDYQKKNFVHADMTPKEFMESMNNNNESLVRGIFRAMGQSMAMQNAQANQGADTEMLMALFSNDREIKLRRAMAKQMQNMESGMLIFEGDNGSTIIDHRNRKAFSVMEREIKRGKTRIGVFYGAGHLPDMEERLLRDFNMIRAGSVWLKAWSLETK